ncbi:alpha/beta hydrolase [Paraglaciecola aquimarina]|uniref:Alpha/beta hydrolase n=1 Tax=Paraglaciecola aquimarina TaxID=1235557 RepID=A0ABU3SWY7_9ALTE|nr:alpha/beta hydrolase [Paraglaciecola aquimarina]MDU0354540.1 alpha/beta hydrolase [Paraglaciecola aquimarina]
MSKMSIAKGLYVGINVVEAKLAKLSKHQILVDGLAVTYLSNVKTFNTDKPILLLLHGFSGDKYVWNKLAKYLSSKHQLLIPDLKGHGETPYRENDYYSVPSQCVMVIKFLDLLNVHQFSVIGNSMGGMIAAKLIESIPQRIHKCVLMDPAGARSTYVMQELDKHINMFEQCSEKDFMAFYKLLMARPPFIPKFILRVLAQEYIRKSVQHARMFEQFYTLDDFFPACHRFVFSNTMLIWGLNDKLLPIDDYQQWKTMLTGCTRIYEDLGHLPMIEDAKRVATDIAAFLAAPAHQE